MSENFESVCDCNYIAIDCFNTLFFCIIHASLLYLLMCVGLVLLAALSVMFGSLGLVVEEHDQLQG